MSKIKSTFIAGKLLGWRAQYTKNLFSDNNKMEEKCLLCNLSDMEVCNEMQRNA